MSMMLAFAGCATTSPTPEPTPRVEEEKPTYTSPAAPERDVDLADDNDFDAAMSLLTAGEYQKGADLLNKVAQRAPRNVAPYINLAIAYRKLERLPAAEESIKKALAIDPDHPVANTEYGLILRKTGRFNEARQAYERTLKREPGLLAARKNLGILCDVYLHDFACGLEHYRIYSGAVPKDQTVRLWIADLEKRLGKSSQ